MSACVHVDVCVGVYIHAYVCIWVCVCPYNAETAEFLYEGSSSSGQTMSGKEASWSGWEAHLCDAAGGSACFRLLPDVVQRLRCGPGCFRSLACHSLHAALRVVPAGWPVVRARVLTKPAVGKEADDTPRGAQSDPESGQPSPTPELSEISACHTLPHYEYLNNVNDPL